MTENSKLRLFAVSALFSALTVAATMIHLPVMSQGGYVHLGDSIIYLAAALLPFRYAAPSAAIGGALADLLAGYFNWAPFTAVIKAMNVIPFLIVSKISDKKKIVCVKNIIACILSGIVTCGLYFLASRIIYGSFAASIADLPGNIIQAVGSAVIYILLGSALDAAKFRLRG